MSFHNLLTRVIIRFVERNWETFKCADE